MKLLKCIIITGLTLGSTSAAENYPPQTWISPDHGLAEVPWHQVRFNGGFWGARFETHQKETISHSLDMLEKGKHIANFDAAAKVIQGAARSEGSSDFDQAAKALEGDAGTKDPAGGAALSATAEGGGITGHSAFDSDLHKALEGACYTLAYREDEALGKRIESILARILAAQEKDGYLVSYYTAKEPQNKWADMRTNHELYNAGHFFEFAVAHQQLTGNTKALEAAKRFADNIDNTFGPGKRFEVDGHQGVELALVKLYRATGEKRYLDLCRFFVDERGHAHGKKREPFTPGPFVPPVREPGLTDYQYSRVIWRAKLYWRNGRMQDHEPLLKQSEAVGHAVRASYIYSAMADLARFSDAPEYAQATRILWDDVVRRKLYLTGGIGTAQYGDEGFGDPYLLPNKTYCESCACIGNVLWQHRMALLEEDAKYADVMELALYNSALSGMGLDGKSFFYQNPLEAKKGSQRREWIGLACCPTNLARFTPQVSGFAYATRADRIYTNLYAQGVAQLAVQSGSTVKITQQTDYPWHGMVKLTIEPTKPTSFDLRLRIPKWAQGQPIHGDLYRYASKDIPAISATLNGSTIEAIPGDDGYLSIKRTWNAGDVVELNLPMPVRRVLAHQNLQENHGRVALMRGPVVYALEGIDHGNTNLFMLSLTDSASLEAHHQPKLLNGVTVITGETRDENGKPTPITAIPYHVWANRGETPMNIWLRRTEQNE